MARKNITSKTQIPQYIQKRITNFKKLTPNKAIFEYEKFLLLRRAKGDYKEFLKGYIETPERVTKKDIQKLHEMRGKKLEEKRYEYERELDINKRIRREQKEDENFPQKIEPPEIPNIEPISAPDLPKIPAEPEPTPPLFVDMSTGQAIFEEDLPDFVQQCKELIDDLIRFTEQQADQAIVSYSSYRSGRTKSSSSRQWLENNINKATDKIIDKLEDIKNDDGLMLSFAKRCASSDYLQSLNDAIGDYISGAYSDVNAEAFYSSQVFNLLSFSPMSLEDTMDFEYEE